MDSAVGTHANESNPMFRVRWAPYEPVWWIIVSYVLLAWFLGVWWAPYEPIHQGMCNACMIRHVVCLSRTLLIGSQRYISYLLCALHDVMNYKRCMCMMRWMNEYDKHEMCMMMKHIYEKNHMFKHANKYVFHRWRTCLFTELSSSCFVCFVHCPRSRYREGKEVDVFPSSKRESKSRRLAPNPDQV
jgi:hypothetical protein